MTARALTSVVLAGVFVGMFWNGPGAIGRYLTAAFVLLVVAGVIDVHAWRAPR